MILSSSLRWQTTLDSEMSSLSDILQGLLTRFFSIVWESMVLCISDLAWSSFLIHLVIELWSNPPSPAQQMFLDASTALYKVYVHKLVYIAGSSVKKQCLTCQHNTTNHCECQPWCELFQSCDIYAANWHLPKYWKKNLTHSSIIRIIFQTGFLTGKTEQ